MFKGGKHNMGICNLEKGYQGVCFSLVTRVRTVHVSRPAKLPWTPDQCSPVCSCLSLPTGLAAHLSLAGLPHPQHLQPSAPLPINTNHAGASLQHLQAEEEATAA
jgi:hypothetical protein